MKIFNLGDKKNIVHDVIIGFIVFIIVEIFKKFIQILPSSGSNILRYISNKVCENASSRIALSLFDIFCVVIILPLFLTFLVLFIISFSNWIKSNKELRQLEKSQDSNNETKKMIKRNHYRMAINLVCAFIGVLCLIELSIDSFLPATLRHSFDIEIKRITPYTATETIQKLESDWVMIKTEEDFLKIYSVINEIRKTNSI